VTAVEQDHARPRRRTRWWPVLLLMVAVLALGGVAVIGGSARQPPAQTVFPATNEPFPYATASDVVSYADHVALVTATAEADTTETAAPGGLPGIEGATYRRVTFRIEATIWSRPDAPAPPAELTAIWWGWLVKDGKRRPFIVNGAPVVFVGAQYVMPIAYDGTAYAPIQPFAVFRCEHGAVALEEQDTPLARQLARRSRDALVGVFASAEPDPVAVKYRDLLPKARLDAVVAARGLEPR
jgi:hypothetical protein